ncbi:zinc finger protein 518A isoform X1 [Megalops cyprinoides]|uniref:zinc finger protein 518A isoform X1 n=1 Tax=Megalops cyprinoides TaxID=118141 RepID=UPI001864ABBC|nr:zinc finger protein 518A isoform X1 [Megalops cyprinoides]XP_036402043.1 zinc finger protein 518A isoform X1 [Megalops cyprinoides]
MEADHTTADDPPEGSKEVDKEDPGNWRTRLRLKQVAVQLPLMQNVDGEYSPEEAEESHEKNKAQTARKSFKRPPLRGQETPPGASISGKILRFSCSECMGQAMFSPNDLLKHFQGVHQGSLPTFPCDMCSFVTHDFSSLQRHRIGHRDTFVRCEICNDSVQYTLLQLTRHFNIFHSLNGYYRCEKCKFSTKDVGTFVQHTHRHNDPQYKCSKCQHVSHSNGEYQKHVLTHAGTYPFTCQLCDYGAPRKDYITKHMATVHGDEMERRTRRSAGEDGPKTLVNSSPGLKLLLTKNPARQTHWMSKGLHALSGGGLLDEFGRLTNPEKTLEETQQFLERTVAAQRDCKKWAKALKTDQQYASQTIPTLSQPKQEAAVTPNTSFLNPNSNGLTVLMVKNKITIPPNCTTKVMGFKMVDGKKHLVLKVIPSGKQESSPKTPESAAASSTSSVAEKDADSQTAETCTEDTHSPVHSEEGTAPLSSQPDLSNAEASPNSTSLCSPLSQQETSTKENDDATSPETSEETGVQKNGDENGQHESPSQAGEAEEQQLPEEENSNKGPATSPTTDSVCPIMDEMEHSSPLKGEDTSQPNGNTSSPESVPDQPGSEMETPLESADPKEMDVSLTCPENIDDDNMSSKSALNSPNQEVFTFHNYSKDTSSLSSDTSLPGDDELVMEDPENDSSQISRASSDGTLKLADLPEQELQDCQEDEVGFTHSPNQDIQDTQSPMGSDLPSMEKVPDSEIEVDECIATVEEEEAPQQVSGMCQTPESPQKSKTALETASPSSEQQMEPLGCDDSVETGTNTKDTSASEPQDHAAKSTEKIDSSGGEKSTASSSNAAMLGKILEQHSDAIISQQLEKERIGTTLNHEVIRTPTTTLRILQPLNLTEGKQQVFLQTAENGYAVPVQLRGSPGFKLITGSVPPINVSYLKPGGERPTNRTAALAFTLSNGRIGTAAQVLGDKEAGGGLAKGGGQNSTTLTTGTQQGAGTSTGSFLVNSSPLKGPLFLSSSIQSVSRERTANAPTCFLVQRPLAVASATATPGGGAATGSSVQTPQSRPMLAVPVNSPDQPTVLQAGRQAFLLRYLSPVKSGILLNSPSEGKATNQTGQTNESGGSRVFLKIVRNASDASFPSCSGTLSSGVTTHTTHANQPIYLATGALQSPYLLMSSNQSILNVSTGTKTSGSSSQDSIQAAASPLLSLSSPTPVQGKDQRKEREEGLVCKLKKARLPHPRMNHQTPKRKRQTKPSVEDVVEPASKARRLSSKKSKEKEGPTVVHWEPVPRDVERTLRLLPFSPGQLIKCPRRNQPVVVLNHPDADIPEVASLMRTVNKFRGEVMKVALSQRTVDALSELDCDTFKQNCSANCHASHGRRVRPQGTVRERFILKLRLKKTSRNKYKVVNTISEGTEQPLTFNCWFCGRVFGNQEEWIGHGQRHLMEATRDWNKLF